MGKHTTPGSLITAFERVALFSDIFSDPPGQLYLSLLKALHARDERDVPKLYGQFFKAVSDIYPLVDAEGGEDIWPTHLARRIAESNNAFLVSAERLSFDDIPAPLRGQAQMDLSDIQQHRLFGPDELAEAIADSTGRMPVSLSGLKINAPPVAKMLLNLKNWSTATESLAQTVRSQGAGIFGQYRAFRWISTAQELRGVESPDPIILDQLWEYHWQKERLVRNTRKLLRGYPANNALLYGDRGTGKSSSVKALVNNFYKDGLRLVEVHKENLVDFPDIPRILRPRAQKFILYIDDLSFEEDDSQFKALKAVWEGGIETRPTNVALYATSNRRNLVKERFSDRQSDGGEEDVHMMDSYQEKLSLADRFGIRLPYSTPDKAAYLNIVHNLAIQAGLVIPQNELDAQAMQWQESRSGRSARQFIDWMVGERGLEQGD